MGIILTLLLDFKNLNPEMLLLVFVVVSWGITQIFSKSRGLQFRTPAKYPPWHAVILLLGKFSLIRILTFLVPLLLWKSVFTDFILSFHSCFVLWFPAPSMTRHSFCKGVAWFVSSGSFVFIPVRTDWEFQRVGVWVLLYDQHTGFAYVAHYCYP